MAYDANGNYYFDPNTDVDDAELYHDEMKRQQVRKVVEQQQQLQKEQQDFNSMWQQTLKEEGLDQQVYTELYNQDPAGVKGHLKEAMQHVARNVKKGRDSKGRFVKQTPQQTRSEIPQQQKPAEVEAKKLELRERATKRHTTDQDFEDILDVLFPSQL